MAAPIGICMTSAYRTSEYVHQGCVYDDEGGGPQYRRPVDTLVRGYTYPEDKAYRRNAADILKVRVKPLADSTAVRVTMNTMTDPDLLGLTLALGSSKEAKEAPFGANTVMPATKFVTVHGASGTITDAATGKRAVTAPAVSMWTSRGVKSRFAFPIRNTTPLGRPARCVWLPGSGTARMTATSCPPSQRLPPAQAARQ